MAKIDEYTKYYCTLQDDGGQHPAEDQKDHDSGFHKHIDDSIETWLLENPDIAKHFRNKQVLNLYQIFQAVLKNLSRYFFIQLILKNGKKHLNIQT